MQRRQFLFSVRGMLLVIALIELPLAFYVNAIKPHVDHRHWYQRVENALNRLKMKYPAEYTHQQWDHFTFSTGNLHGNSGGAAAFIRNKADADHFADELELRLDQPVNEQTIDWIWDSYKHFSRVNYDQWRPTTPENRLLGSRLYF